MKAEIQRLHRETVDTLSTKGIDYSELRAGLVPSQEKHEAAFIFDSRACASGLYGREFMAKILPLLDRRSTHSILVGDLIGENQPLIRRLLEESMVSAIKCDFEHSSILYGVYINNISGDAIKRLHEALTRAVGYVGHIPVTYASRIKWYLSTTLIGFLLKNGRKLIMGHEEDRPNTENIDITTYDLEKSGYAIASLQEHYFSLFLSYKIERPAFFFDAIDNEIALNSISAAEIPIDDCKVLLTERKHGYVASKKRQRLQQALIDVDDRCAIENLVQTKIRDSYIYDLRYREEYDVATFNVMLEIGRPSGYPARITVALEYMPQEKLLRIVTMH